MLNSGLNPELLFDRPVAASKSFMGYRASSGQKLNWAFFSQAGGSFTRPDAEGSFTVKDVYPGRFWIVGAAPHPYYLAAVQAGGAELATPEVDLSSGNLAMTLVFKADGGSVHGTAEKCNAGPVLLVPQEARLRVAGLLRRAFCDSQDRYEIRSVRPGNYYLMAFSGNGDVPKMDEAMVNQGSRIVVRAGEAASVDLKATARPGY